MNIKKKIIRISALLTAGMMLLSGCSLTLKEAGAEKNYDEGCIGAEGILNGSGSNSSRDETSDVNQGCIGPGGILISRGDRNSSKEESSAEESSKEESSGQESSAPESSVQESSKEESSAEESSVVLLSGWIETQRTIPAHIEQEIQSDVYRSYPALYRAVDNQEHTRILQRRLNELGYDLYEDGYYGEAVEDAVADYQLKHNLLDSGAVCGDTWRALYSEWVEVPETLQPTRSYADPETHELVGPGLVTIDEVLYYFDEDQMLHVGPEEIAVDGILYAVDEEGKAEECMDDALWAAKEILDKVGYDLYQAYYWCSTEIPYKRDFAYYPYSSTITQLSVHTDFYALQSFDTGIGMCFNYAACFYQMARLLGYHPTYIEGYVPIEGGVLNHHAWVEMYEDGRYMVYDPTLAYEAEAYEYCYDFPYGTDGTWIYCAFEWTEEE